MVSWDTPPPFLKARKHDPPPYIVSTTQALCSNEVLGSVAQQRVPAAVSLELQKQAARQFL